MDRIVERCAGLDVHKDLVVAHVRYPGDDGERLSQTASYSTFTADLLALRDWLVSLGVTRVGMEATGVYWKPIFYVLEETTECWLLNARHMANVPGRKTDVADAEWIAQLVEHGLVRPSFVPPPAIRDIRELTRYRRTVTEERSREAQRLDKVLQDAGLKLSSVASDVLGMSARLMLDALVAGTNDPAVLADLAKGHLRKKLPALQEALNARFSHRHAVVVAEILAHLDYLDESVERLSAAVDEALAPFADARDRLTTIPGVNRRLAEALIGEIGADMSRFPTAAHLASGPGCAPDSTSQPASPARGRPGTATRGSGVTSPWRPWPPPAPRGPTSRASTTVSLLAGASAGPARPWAIPSWWLRGTSWPLKARPMRNSATTGSTAATIPPVGPDASSPSFATWAATSRPMPTAPSRSPSPRPESLAPPQARVRTISP